MSVLCRFLIRAEPSATDNATTVSNLIWIQNLDDSVAGERYAFPDDKKAVIHHEALFSLPPAIAAKRDLKPRWVHRCFRASLSPEIAELYFDSSGNAVFQGTMLNVFMEEMLLQPPRSRSDSSNSSSTSGSSAQATAAPAPRALSSIVKDAVISKFNPSERTNAAAWIDIFERECSRLGIDRGRFWEVIRLFVQDGAEKWYTTLRLSSDSTSWEFWKASFMENFGGKGLGAARLAFSFKYIGGSLSDYCQSKLSLLASFNPKMHEDTKIAMVALGLPQHLQDRINLDQCSTLGALLSVINSFDQPRSSKFGPEKSSPDKLSSDKPSSGRQQCGYCKKRGQERFHPEKDCYSKKRDLERKARNSDKAVNSLELEELQQEIDEITKN